METSDCGKLKTTAKRPKLSDKDSKFKNLFSTSGFPFERLDWCHETLLAASFQQQWWNRPERNFIQRLRQSQIFKSNVTFLSEVTVSLKIWPLWRRSLFCLIDRQQVNKLRKVKNKSNCQRERTWIFIYLKEDVKRVKLETKLGTKTQI